MTRVKYHCTAHGFFHVDVQCGHGYGPAPDRQPCPVCGRRSHRRNERAGRDQSAVSLSADTFARLKAYCDGQGVSISSLIDALCKDIP